ncbi:MAG TPA: glutamyl-tRNA reductase [Anaerolineales bacterium]|nr:glutamyl-tRNA reductase [Anaerolineales bacterium]
MPDAKHAVYIHCLGLNHTTSNVELRERLAYDSHALQSTLARLGCGDDPAWDGLKEFAILSTCNRVELYTVAARPVFDTLEAFLSETQNCPRSEFSGSLYRLMDGEATQHLLDVAAGLDSLVIGEPQILGQVTEAYAAARKHGILGKILSRLFLTAIHAGKRARTETSINQNPASIASVAVSLISETVPDLPAAKIMVLGAGEMAELAVEALRKRGAKSVLVVNRTLARAEELASRWSGQAAALETLLEHLPEMDIVISSTGAPHTVIRPSMVAEAMKLRSQRPLVFMDIAVPRDVDTEVKSIPGVYLHDIDTLSSHLESNLAQREAEVPKVREIIAEERRAFEEYLATLDVIPIIIDMHNQADSIRQKEVRKAIRRMPDLTPEMERQIDALTRSIVNKLLHSPTTCLRKEANSLDALDYASVARALFGLE